MKRTPGRGPRAVLSLLVLALAASTAATAWAVEVRGTLTVPSGYGQSPPESDEQQRRNRYWEEWNGFIDPRPPRFEANRELAVVLTGPGDMAPEQPGFALANGTLSPATLVERVGGTLRIANTDPVTHQLYADGLAEFTPSPTSPGLTRQQVVGTAGSWPIGDRIYGHVRGHLHVVPDLIARAQLQADGSYLFRNVPPGTYTLKVFHREREVHSAEVTVAEGRELAVPPITIAAR